MECLRAQTLPAESMPIRQWVSGLRFRMQPITLHANRWQCSVFVIQAWKPEELGLWICKPFSHKSRLTFFSTDGHENMIAQMKNENNLLHAPSWLCCSLAVVICVFLFMHRFVKQPIRVISLSNEKLLMRVQLVPTVRETPQKLGWQTLDGLILAACWPPDLKLK